MQDLQARSIAREYWASFFNCPAADLFASSCRIDTHGPELEGYWGAQALFRNGAVMISLPPGSDALLADSLSDAASFSSPDGFAAVMAPFSALTLGPAFIGYATEMPASGQSVRSLYTSDKLAHRRLEADCDPVEWDHGGGPLDDPCSGVFVEDQLAAFASYEVWGDTIAHISIITHPEFRGHGHARSAVADLGGRALSAGLLPQYRTLESNESSIRVARALGFLPYASSIAVRFSPDGKGP